jgi:hypothetical protein
MNRLNFHLSPKTEDDLQKLVEPLANYIAAGGQSRVMLIAAMILLFQNLQEINGAAKHYLDTFSENHID